MGEMRKDNFEIKPDVGAADLVKGDFDLDLGETAEEAHNPDAQTKRDMKPFEETLLDIREVLQTPYSHNHEKNIAVINTMIEKFAKLEDEIAMDPLLTPDQRKALMRKIEPTREEIRQKRSAI